jgi:hypothetical protein
MSGWVVLDYRLFIYPLFTSPLPFHESGMENLEMNGRASERGKT